MRLLCECMNVCENKCAQLCTLLNKFAFQFQFQFEENKTHFCFNDQSYTPYSLTQARNTINCHYYLNF